MSEMMLHDDRDTIIAGLRQQLRECREELAAEKAKDSGVEEGVAQLRRAVASRTRPIQGWAGSHIWNPAHRLRIGRTVLAEARGGLGLVEKEAWRWCGFDYHRRTPAPRFADPSANGNPRRHEPQADHLRCRSQVE